MKEFTLCYKTNVVAPICGYDTVEEAKAAIEKLTANASKTNSKFDSVEFFIEDSEMNVSFIIYDDGTWFSPYDWHGYIPETPENIEEIAWMIGATGRKAIMLNGLPRMLV